ncbi:MAG: M16 family metallopeptidase [Opitutaceae bacterium]
MRLRRPKLAKPGAGLGDTALLEAFWREPVQRTVLPNGVVVVLKPDASAALASVQVWVRSGSVHEGTQLGAGLSHFLEHMLFKGTARRDGRAISATIQAHGGYLNAYTTYDRTVYYVDLPSEHAAVAVDVLADAVLHSTLPEEEVAKERDVILREIAMTRDDPDNRLWDALFATAFREHPYRHPIIGHRDVFAAVSRQELLTYYRERYTPENLVVVVVGDVDASAMLAEIGRHFGAVPRRRSIPVLIPAEPRQLAPRREHRVEDVELCRAVLAWPIPGLAHADAPALDLLAALLGQGESSLLWRQVRDRAGLVHQIDAGAWNPGSTGLFCISYTCDPDKRAGAEAAIQRALRRYLDRPVPASDLRKARRQLVVGEINSRKTMSGQASRLGAAEVVVGDLDHGRTYFGELARVTGRSLQAVAVRHLTASSLITVSTGPAAAAAGSGVAVRCAAPTEFTETRLANGARLLLQPDPRLPNLHLRLLLPGGPLSEAPDRRGASALLSTLLTKDTRRRTAAEVAGAIESVGGALYPFCGNNSLGIAVEVLPSEAALAVALLAEAILEPAFREGTFRLERDAQVAALRQDDDDVVTWARKRLRRRFFGADPLGLDASGDIAGVQALTPADLAALHRRLAVAGNAVLAVAGDFDPVALRRPLERLLSRLPSGGGAGPAVPSVSLPAERGAFVEFQPREQAVVLRAYPGPALHAADFYTGEVLDECLSGMASRLFERVREDKGLAYFVRSARVTGLRSGMFSFLAGTQPGKEDEVLGEIDAEIARIAAGGIEPAELARCQTRLKAARRQSLQTPSARALQAGLNALQGLDLNDWRQYDSKVEGVSVAMLAAFARERLRPEHSLQLVVRPVPA